MKIVGEFLRQAKVGYFARVHLNIEPSAIAIIEVGKKKYDNTFNQGELVNAPSSQVDLKDWIEGAELGIKYGLLAKSSPSLKIVIEDIEGVFTDTNPLIISVATIFGIWQFLDYQPIKGEREKVEDWALASWGIYRDSYPEELDRLRTR